MPVVQLRNSQSRNDGSLKKDHMAFNRKVNIFSLLFLFQKIYRKCIWCISIFQVFGADRMDKQFYYEIKEMYLTRTKIYSGVKIYP